MSERVVVVADDDPDLRPLIALTLRKAGFEVEEVDNGTDALAAIGRRRPDLAVLDVTMPGLSGPEVVARVRADASVSSCRILLLTAHRLDAGDADDYLPKPFSPRELVARVQALVD